MTSHIHHHASLNKVLDALYRLAPSPGEWHALFSGACLLMKREASSVSVKLGPERKVVMMQRARDGVLVLFEHEQFWISPRRVDGFRLVLKTLSFWNIPTGTRALSGVSEDSISSLTAD